ncbi:hypothetical protein [Jatrophihabitans fulvus]
MSDPLTRLEREALAEVLGALRASIAAGELQAGATMTAMIMGAEVAVSVAAGETTAALAKPDS